MQNKIKVDSDLHISSDDDDDLLWQLKDQCLDYIYVVSGHVGFSAATPNVLVDHTFVLSLDISHYIKTIREVWETGVWSEGKDVIYWKIQEQWCLAGNGTLEIHQWLSSWTCHGGYTSLKMSLLNDCHVLCVPSGVDIWLRIPMSQSIWHVIGWTRYSFQNPYQHNVCIRYLYGHGIYSWWKGESWRMHGMNQTRLICGLYVHLQKLTAILIRDFDVNLNLQLVDVWHLNRLMEMDWTEWVEDVKT